MTEPFLKWAGGKRQLLPELLPRVPKSFGAYHEPFLGGGALFFALRPKRAVLSDINARLVHTYRGIRDHVEDVIAQLKEFRYEETFYYEQRERDIDACVNTDIAAWFIYINRCGFNGLYRVNKAGKCNVPFGRYTNPTICNAPLLRECSEALQNAEIVTRDFESTVAAAGDFVYLDCPYVPLSATGSFVGYAAGGFTREDQVRLHAKSAALCADGAHVLLSNSYSGFVLDLYRDWPVSTVRAHRNINSKGTRRGQVDEALIVMDPTHA